MPMPPPLKSKLEQTLPRNELADFLRRLADQARSGAIAFPEGDVPLAGMKSFKIAVKDSGHDLTVTVRLKFPEPEPLRGGSPARPPGSPGTAARPRYKSLKKRMKRDFKDIGAALAAGFPPRPDLLAAFVADSRLMTTYRGKGDAHYPDYLAAVEALEAAGAAADLEAMVRAYRRLAVCKKACHARHA